MTKNFNINLVKNLLLYREKENYLNNKYYEIKYLSNFRPGNVVFVESFYYDNTNLRKQFFLGVCISREKGLFNSSIILRNVLSGYLVDQKFLIFNRLILSLRISKKRKLNVKKNKLFFLTNLPFLFRINKFVLNETFYYLKKNKKK
jgi:ribosomal protein L19